VVFDLGGVLLDWDPRHLYRKLFADETEMELFLADICSPAWHVPHDRGISTAASCAELASRHPRLSEMIWAWSGRSEEMIGGVHAESVDVLRAVRDTGLPCYALTTMEAETYPLRLQRFPFLGWFDGTVVSGREGVAKPEPAIFMRLLDRFGLTPRTTLMIDDTEANLDTARRLGMQTSLFLSSLQLRAELEAAAVLPRTVVPARGSDPAPRRGKSWRWTVSSVDQLPGPPNPAAGPGDSTAPLCARAAGGSCHVRPQSSQR
jgi:2-haloacid dehalogenase